MRRGHVIFLLAAVCIHAGYAQEWSNAELNFKKHLGAGSYDSALYYAEEAAAIMRGTIGENNLQYAFMLRKLAYAHFYLGNYRKSMYFILKESGLWESKRKTNDPEYISCLRAASVICRKAGSYEEALVQIRKADKKALDLYKPDSREYSEILYCYAGVYHDLGNSVSDQIFLSQEERYLRKAEEIYLKSGEREIRNLLINKSDMAAVKNNKGNFPAAESYLTEVSESCARIYGEQSTAYAASLNNLGILNYNAGNFKQAENCFSRALKIYKQDPEEDRPEAAISLNNLGAVYYQIGNFETAGKLFTEARKTYEAGKKMTDQFYSVILNNMASMSMSADFYADLENKNPERLKSSGDLLRIADSVFNMNCQKPHPYLLAISSNRIVWYYLNGEEKKAWQLKNDIALDYYSNSRIVAMMNKMNVSAILPDPPETRNGPSPDIIAISNDLISRVTDSDAGLITNDAQFLSNTLVRAIFGKAEGIRKALGPYHPAYGWAIRDLYMLYGQFNDVKREEELRLEYMNILNMRTLQDFSFLSEPEKEMYYQTRLPDFHAFTSYALERKRTNPYVTRYAFNNILLNKGLMLKSSTAMRSAILNSNDPVLLKDYEEWIALQKELSTLYSTPVEDRVQDVSLLEQKSVELERGLVARSQEFGDFRKGLQITWEDVRKTLGKEEAAIEFIDFKRLAKDGGQSSLYCALLVRQESEYPEMIRLFTDKQLRAVIDQSGANNFNDIKNIYGTASGMNDTLYKLIWKPLEKYLDGIRNIYISPSGLLNKISFPAIGAGRGVYLCDTYNIHVSGSTGSIALRRSMQGDSLRYALIFGGIQYSAGQSGSDVWNYLEGTRKEGDVVSNILSNGKVNVSYLSGSMATETYFKENAGRYNIMHLATHGFFFDDPNRVRFEEEDEKVEYGEITFRGASSASLGVNSFVNNENPLMRSGLVLAGANEVWTTAERSGPDDGVLTAQEVAQIDMRKSNLVVLSACETGLGDIKGTEGVYGLQRALKMAGVRYLVTSLWEIPDRETVEFMELFYSGLVTSKEIPAAFNNARMRMRQKYDPYYWGAFVLTE